MQKEEAELAKIAKLQMQKEEAKLAWWKVHATSATTCCKTWMGGDRRFQKGKGKKCVEKVVAPAWMRG